MLARLTIDLALEDSNDDDDADNDNGPKRKKGKYRHLKKNKFEMLDENDLDSIVEARRICHEEHGHAWREAVVAEEATKQHCSATVLACSEDELHKGLFYGVEDDNDAEV
eukprot:2327053-Ditylum_brightwellii.AAC.1